MVFPSERVLITGGTGFTGRPLAELLRQGGQDVVITGPKVDGDGTLAADIRDLDAVTGLISQVRPSAIVHLAGISDTRHAHPSELYCSNVVGTANLLESLCVAKLEPKVVVIVSSAQVYAVNDLHGHLTEDSPVAPTTHYAVSKRTVEDVARIYSSRFPIIITRPFNYTGPGQSPTFFIPKIIQHYVESRSEIHLGNLDVYRDFSDIRRVVHAYSRLASGAIGPATTNICSGRAIYLADVLTMMESIAGRTIKVVQDRALSRGDEPRRFVGSPARLEALAGPLPNPEFQETLSQMYEQAKKAHNNRLTARASA